MAMEEKEITMVLEKDYSEGTDTFREELLARCLDVLDMGEAPRKLSDDELDMLSAAGVFELRPDIED